MHKKRRGNFPTQPIPKEDKTSKIQGPYLKPFSVALDSSVRSGKLIIM